MIYLVCGYQKGVAGMTKSERLLFIVNLFRVKKRVTLKELAGECEVSTRTIYRDLLSLSSLNIPVYYSNGYRLTRDVSLPALNFSSDEQELLGYSLRNTVLSKSRYLKERLRNIELKILSALPEKSRDRLNFQIMNPKTESCQFTRSEEKILRLFFRALFSKEDIDLELKLGRRRIIRVKAVSLHIKGCNWMFCFADRRARKTFKIGFRRIHSLRFSSTAKKSE
jgi:predicted DNA-binding transcriptional regulator YafY